MEASSSIKKKMLQGIKYLPQLIKRAYSWETLSKKKHTLKNPNSIDLEDYLKKFDIGKSAVLSTSI
jgi:hypothetical protein